MKSVISNFYILHSFNPYDFCYWNNLRINYYRFSKQRSQREFELILTKVATWCTLVKVSSLNNRWKMRCNNIFMISLNQLKQTAISANFLRKPKSISASVIIKLKSFCILTQVFWPLHSFHLQIHSLGKWSIQGFLKSPKLPFPLRR